MDERATLHRLEAEAGAACMGCGMVRAARSAVVVFEAPPRVRVTCAACAARGAFPAARAIDAERFAPVGELACACGAVVGAPGAGGLVRATAHDGHVTREVRCGACCARLVQRVIDNASRSRPPRPAGPPAPEDGLNWPAPDRVARLADAAEGTPCACCPALVGTGPAMAPGNVGLVQRGGAWHALAFCAACAGSVGVEATGAAATQGLLARAAARRPS